MMLVIFVVMGVLLWLSAEVFDAWPGNFIREYLREKEKPSSSTEEPEEAAEK